MDIRYLVVLSDPDPIAGLLAEQWAGLPGVGAVVDGAPIRELAPGVHVVRRLRAHIDDADLSSSLPADYRTVPLVFPSRHRSESGIGCLTVHALGNLGDSAEVGGEPRRLVPSPARLMADALRQLTEPADALGVPATYEATHHGPLLHQPGFFIEVADVLPLPTRATAASAIAELLRDLRPDPADRVVVGAGGGHYAPHFTEMTLARHWAFSHIVPRHAMDGLTPDVLHQLRQGPEPPDGVLFQRSHDATRPEWGEWPRLRDAQAPPRPTGGPSTGP